MLVPPVACRLEERRARFRKIRCLRACVAGLLDGAELAHVAHHVRKFWTDHDLLAACAFGRRRAELVRIRFGIALEAEADRGGRRECARASGSDARRSGRYGRENLWDAGR